MSPLAQGRARRGLRDPGEITITEAGVPRMWTDGPQLRTPFDGLDYLVTLLADYP